MSSQNHAGLGRGLVTGAFLASLLLLSTACGSSDGQTAAQDRGSASGTSGGSNAAQERLPPPGEAWVIFGTDTVQAEVARTVEEREQGLMFREKLEEGRGMLFVFPDVQTRSFWMENTLIPLDIAYLDENLLIVDIQPMEPLSTDLHPSAKPAMFALEVPMGWFAAQGIAIGAEARMVFGPG
jgi:uncharacterized membrane protein (UPF0127 family)